MILAIATKSTKALIMKIKAAEVRVVTKRMKKYMKNLSAAVTKPVGI